MTESNASTERPAVVFIEELEDRRAARFLGRFGARFEPKWRVTADQIEGVTAEEAIGWGRARAGLVLVSFGRRVELWSAGATPHWSYPRGHRPIFRRSSRALFHKRTGRASAVPARS